jgi:hypothetical protein
MMAACLLGDLLMEIIEIVAKALGCDDDKARFEAKLGKLAKAKPVPKVK